MRVTLLLLSLLFLAVSSCAMAQSQREMNEDCYQKYQKAESAMVKVYTDILTRYADDANFNKMIKKAQAAWEAFRDAEADAVFPPVENMKAEYGSIYPLCSCLLLRELTEERTIQLKAFLSATRDPCAPDESPRTPAKKK